MRWFVLLTFTIRVFASSFDEVTPSSPEEIASLNTDLLIDGFVSAASGQLSIAQPDLHVRGAQDLILQRTYLPPQIFGRYEDKEERDRLELGKALNQLHVKGWVVLPHIWAGNNRNSPYFQVRDPQGTVLEFSIVGNRGHLKTSGYGCSNLKGGEPSASADIRNIELFVEGAQVVIVWPNGTKRVYKFHSGGSYYLDSEFLPNGKAIRYSYNKQGLPRITSTDLSGKYIYAFIDSLGNGLFRGSDGREAKLVYEMHEIKGKFKKGKFKETATFQFPVLTSASNPKYSHSVGYNDRTLLTSYDAKCYPISCSYWQQKDSVCRIQTFSTPSGSIHLSYDSPIPGKKGGSTTVKHPNQSETIYRFNSQFLVSAIENWHEGKMYNQKLFTYDSKQHIAKIETKDGQGHALLIKTYECDQAGNPISEQWEGDFGLFSIQRTFSKNRVVKEVYSDGLGFEYAYLGDTHLITAKNTLSEGNVVRIAERIYDDACNLIEEREVGKTITTYLLYQQGAHLHLPEWKVEKDWEGKLIHKTHFVYDGFGYVAEEAHYGSDDKLAYRTTQLHDSHDNLLEETNPLGEVASYSYDGRGRQVKEVPFGQNKTIQSFFDGKGRLITLQEGGHTTQFVYNSSDELTRKTDYLGLETHYSYHPVHGKPISIQEEPTRVEITYDDFGREVERKNAYGAKTITHCNSYGDPILIVRPDGGKESFVYAPNRTLLAAVDPDGLQTSYTYDSFKRMLSKTAGTRKTTYTYDAYDLLEEKDALGTATQYQYNFLRQKVKEIRGNRVIEFSYDSLGFLSKMEIGNRWTTFQNDVLGRLEKKSIDGRLDTSYTYDSAGNITSIMKQDPVHFSYDSYDRLIEKIDATGARTDISYEERDKCLIKTIKDPKGVNRIETYNAHGLLLKKEVPGCLLEEYSYDRALRLASQDHLTFTYTLEGLRASQAEGKQRTTSWTYTPGGKIQSKIKPDGTVLHYEYTQDGELARVGSREFQYDPLGRVIQGTGFSREYDLFGNVVKETLATGLTVRTTYDDSDRPIQRILPDQSSIAYEYEGPFLVRISRLSADGDLLYIHTYDQFDLGGRVLSETGLFKSSYSYDRAGRRISQTSPFFSEELAYDESGNLIRNGDHSYAYDAADQMICSSGEFSFEYDKHHNRIAKNGHWSRCDELNQIEGQVYDENGCLIEEGYVFDEFDQLTKANGESIAYDAIGRRISKGNTAYFYTGDEEIGACEKGKVKELKISGLLAPVALEIDNQVYNPIADVQGTIRVLIDPNTSNICAENSCDPFGVGLCSEIPYAYAGKRYDVGSGLVYFGKRYYVPSLGRWLTPDPIGPVDHSNLYQYLFNNPYRFQDPNGESIGGYLLGLGEILLGGTIMAGGFALEVVTVGGFTFGVGLTTSTGAALMGLGLATTAYNAQDMKMPSFSWKNTEVYAPDRPLPNTPDGIHIPDTDAPHTQLGTQEGRRGKYPQAREFDEHGNPVRDIDFTDHGRPQHHRNPHQHDHIPNPTGGTPERSKNPKPVDGWKYS